MTNLLKCSRGHEWELLPDRPGDGGDGGDGGDAFSDLWSHRRNVTDPGHREDSDPTNAE